MSDKILFILLFTGSSVCLGAAFILIGIMLGLLGRTQRPDASMDQRKKVKKTILGKLMIALGIVLILAGLILGFSIGNLVF